MRLSLAYAAKGMAHLDPLLERIQADESLPLAARELFAVQSKEYAQLRGQINEVEAKLKAWHKSDECSQRLIKIPGVGPIGAVLLKMKTPAPEQFRTGRQFAAWIGLTRRIIPPPARSDTAASPAQATKLCAPCWWLEPLP